MAVPGCILQHLLMSWLGLLLGPCSTEFIAVAAAFARIHGCKMLSGCCGSEHMSCTDMTERCSGGGDQLSTRKCEIVSESAIKHPC